MSDEQSKLSRRESSALAMAAGLGADTGAARGGGAQVSDADVEIEIETPSGTCDAALIHPQGGGRWPAVILFPDALGLRPTMRDMAKRLAANGYTVLIPNPYYRSARAPGVEPGFDFSNAADRERLSELRAPLTGSAVMEDSAAYVAFLDGHASVDRQAKMGVFGYCMGGAMTIQAAAANPERIGAGASFHGGGLVTDKPDSPHRLIAKLKARYYVGVAVNDDAKEPDAKTALKEAFRAANLSAKVEVYDGCLHGWCIKDMPAAAGRPIYNEPQAERAWNELVTLYKKAHV